MTPIPSILLWSILLTVHATAQPSTEVTLVGSVRAFGDEPLARVDIRVTDVPGTTVLQEILVEPDGSFKLNIRESTIVRVAFMAPYHITEEVFVIPNQDDTVNLSVTLGQMSFVEKLDEVRVIGSFNNFSLRNSLPVEIIRDKLRTKLPINADTVEVQLSFLENHGYRVPANAGGAFQLMQDGSYSSSIVATTKRTTVLDLSRLPNKRGPGSIVCTPPIGRTSHVARELSAIPRRTRFGERMGAYVPNRSSAFLNETYPYESEISDLEFKLRTERDPLIRAALFISYVDLAGRHKEGVNLNMIQRALREIQPSSILWSVNPSLLEIAVNASRLPEFYDYYLEEVFGANPDSLVRLQARRLMFTNTYVRRMRDSILSTSGKVWFDKVHSTTNPDRRVLVGQMVPRFSLGLVDNPHAEITSESLTGSVYMLCFWSSWCPGCVHGFPEVVNLYREFKEYGLKFVSVSFDYTRKEAQSFTAAYDDLEWLNGFVGLGAEQERLWERFETSGIPMILLVSAEGRILYLAKGFDSTGLAGAVHAGLRDHSQRN